MPTNRVSGYPDIAHGLASQLTEPRQDIQTCQGTYGKTILLSIGGATYTEGGFSSASAAVAAANQVWAMFGPAQSAGSAHRPFGNAVVDGFDFDFESSTQNMVPYVLLPAGHFLI